MPSNIVLQPAGAGSMRVRHGSARALEVSTWMRGEAEPELRDSCGGLLPVET